MEEEHQMLARLRYLSPALVQIWSFLPGPTANPKYVPHEEKSILDASWQVRAKICLHSAMGFSQSGVMTVLGQLILSPE